MFFFQVADTIEAVIAQFAKADGISEDESADSPLIVTWGPVDGTSLKQFDFTEHSVGFSPEIYEHFIDKQPYDVFKQFVTDEIIDLMVSQTNIYAEQVLRGKPTAKGYVKKWIPTNNKEMETFIGFILWMGLMKLPRLKAYWTANLLYVNKVKEVMPRNRFEQLLQMCHFNNNEDERFANDRLRKLTPLVERLLDRFQNVYIPKSDVCSHETLVPFRGRLRFRQYIKNKKNKFSIKLYKLCTSGGYTYNLKIYCGSENKEGGLAS